jgi:FkbM family methyltransferase
LGKDISVLAFEPVSQQYHGFSENIERNRITNIKLNQLIVSDTCARQAIHLGESWNSGSASISTTYDGSSAVEEVDSITLDTYCRQENLPRVDVIKIDVEGHEMSVLKAAIEVFAKYRPILFIEVRDHCLRDAHSSREELYAFMSKAGYRPFAITPAIELRPILSPVDGSLIVFKPDDAP